MILYFYIYLNHLNFKSGVRNQISGVVCFIQDKLKKVSKLDKYLFVIDGNKFYWGIL